MKCLIHVWIFLAGVIAFAAEAPLRRGILVYPDGNRITGRLAAEGVFASDRFGELRFAPADAKFEPALDMPSDDTPGGLKERVEAEIKTATKTVPPSTASESATKPNLPWWHPWKLSISGYADSTTDDGSVGVNITEAFAWSVPPNPTRSSSMRAMNTAEPEAVSTNVALPAP